MLIESIIKKTIELQGFRIESVTQGPLAFFVRIVEDRRFKPRCGVCGAVAEYRDRRGERLFRHVPLWGVPVILIYTPRRVTCGTCGGIHVEALPWASGKRRLTTAFACFLATWARLLPWLDVSRLFQVSWGTVASSVELVVAYGLSKREVKGVTHIGIDEISRKRGHVYLTNVYDLKAKTLLWSGEDRGKETMKGFFAFLGSEQASKLQGVCCDMWEPYVEVVKECAPQAVLVFDKFHIVRHLMDAVDQVRRDEIREKGKEHKDLLKDTRYIWLKNPWNLTDKQKVRLASLERLNLGINRAYMLKEAFRRFWSYNHRGWAEKYLKKWFWWATHSRLKPIRDFAWMLRRHEENILSYFKEPIHNATVEGLNNKAKVISRRAYGFRSVRTFILNLYHGMADLPMPKLLHTFV
jgi:transposase